MCRFIAALVLVVCAVTLSKCRAQDLAPSPEDVMEILRARDAQFDNLMIEVLEKGERFLPPYPVWRDPEFAKEQGLMDDSGTVIGYRTKEVLVYRRGEITYDRRVLDSTIEKGNPAFGIVPHQRWSNAGKYVKDYRNPTGSEVLSISPNSPEQSSGDIHLREFEFTLGFGFGKRLASIEKVALENNLLVVDGILNSVGGTGAAKCRLNLDQKFYVARKARVEVLGTRKLVYEVTTEGIAGMTPFYCAASGEMVVTTDSSHKELQVRKFSLEVENCEIGLSDAKYSDLVRMPSNPGMQIQDPFRLQSDLENTFIPTAEDATGLWQAESLGLTLTILILAALALLTIRKYRRPPQLGRT